MSDEYDAYLLWKLSAQQQIDNFRKETKAVRAENAKLRELASKCMDALRGNGISLDEYEKLEGMAYSLRVDA